MPLNGCSQAPDFAAIVNASSAGQTVPSQELGTATSPPSDRSSASAALGEYEDADVSPKTEELTGSALPEDGQIVPLQPQAGLLAKLQPMGSQMEGGMSGSKVVSPSAHIEVVPEGDASGRSAIASTNSTEEHRLEQPVAERVAEAVRDAVARVIQDEGKGAALTRGGQGDTASSGLQPSAQMPGASGSLVGFGTGGARAEVRPSVELDSTIAQVIEIREALRSARPQLTLQHAEFGLVSLRLEATGSSQDWRAVLASRDPGFAQAFQTALTERALTASAGTSANSTGTGAGPGSGQSSFAIYDHRYGFSPGSGQGSSLPYSAQSGPQDEGASKQHGQNHRRHDETASKGLQEVSRVDHRQQGLFA